MKTSVDFSLYLVTAQGIDDTDALFNSILQAVEGGVKAVQLRNKSISTSEMIQTGKKLLALLKPRGIPLIINDRIDVAIAIQADGIHLGQSDMKISEARAIIGRKAIIGLSVETLEQATAAEDQDINYLAASPVFYSPSKATQNPPWGLDGLKLLCSISRHPVIAIGGIGESNIADVFKCGAAGAAVISAIFNAPCPKLAALEISNRLSNVR
jgi:thiamine-phosphate pyrophosphorylase